MTTDASLTGWGAFCEFRTLSGVWTTEEAQAHINLLELEAVVRAVKALAEIAAGKKPDGLLGQHYYRGLHKQAGRDKIPEPMPENVVLSPLVSRARHTGESFPHSGSGEHVGRRVVERPGESRGVGASTTVGRLPFQEVRQTTSGPVCDGGECQTANVLLEGFRPPGRGRTDALSFSWDGLDSYAFPPFGILHRVLLKIRASMVRVLLIAPLWPRRPWFPLLLHLLVELPVVLPVRADLISQDRGRVLHPRAQDPTSYCLEVVRDSLRAQGLPEDIASLAAGSRRPSTFRTYDSRLSRFRKWCSENQASPTSASLEQVSRFFKCLFDQGRQVSTIKNYRSAIAAVHKGFPDGSSMGNNPILAQLLRGMSNARPVVRSLVPSWSINQVLEALAAAPYEPLHDTSLPLLTHKTLFLVAAASGKTPELPSGTLGEAGFPPF